MPRELVANYAAAVIKESLDWLVTASDEDLERPILMVQSQAAFPVYRADGHLAEVRELLEIPTWMVLARPAISHVRVHNGELQLLAQALHRS